MTRPRGLRLRIGMTGLDHDRDFGVARRTGWSVCIRGSYTLQFVSLPRALWGLVCGLWRAR